MADNVAVTAGTGTTIAADEVTDGTLGSCKVQFVKIMDGTLDGTTKAAVGSTGLAVNATVAAAATNIAKAEDAASASGDVGVPAMAVQLATPTDTAGTDGDYSILQMSGGRLWVDASGKTLTVNASGNAVPVTDNSGSLTVDNAGTFAVQATIASGATSIAKAEDVASADADVGVPAMAIQKASPADTAGTDGDYAMLQMSGGRLWVDASGKTLTVGSHAVTNAGTFAVQDATLEGAVKNEDVASANADPMVIVGVKRSDTAAATSGTDGDYEPLQTAGGKLWTRATMASGDVASGAFASGSIASGAVASGAFASGSIASGAIASGAIAAGAIATGATSIAANEDDASANADTGVKILVVRKATPANTSGTDGDYENLQTSGGYLWVHDNKGLSNRAFSVAFTTLTRPANTTAYAAGDSISDNATAGSVTALSATVSDVNDDPIFISEIRISSTDTGLAGKRIRAYLFNSDPTASSGVGGGDNAAYSQKVAGYVGSLSGVLETGFSDGTVGRLVPSFNDSTASPSQHAPAGGFIVCKPTSGAATLYIQYQAIDAFTPSANSTTIIGSARGWQGRAS